MSDLGFSLGSAVSRPRVSLLEALAQPASAFRPNARFSDGAKAVAQPEAPINPRAAEDQALADAYARGYAEGHALASEEAEARMMADAVSRVQLAINFDRLGDQLQEDLRMRLREVVAGLCEATLAPLALDQAALVQRIERTVAMLSRADDERIIRLHPADIDLVAAQMRADWTILADPSLDRGSVRVETETGGVEDGPVAWRRAISEALSQA